MNSCPDEPAGPDRIVLESDLMIKTSKEIEKTNRILIAAAVVLTALLQFSLPWLVVFHSVARQ